MLSRIIDFTVAHRYHFVQTRGDSEGKDDIAKKLLSRPLKTGMKDVASSVDRTLYSRWSVCAEISHSRNLPEKTAYVLSRLISV